MIKTIVIGGLNTDIIALGAPRILKSGEHAYVRELKIGPGGKSRNIAQMIATLLGRDTVAMIGKTSRDPYGLWKPPLETLHRAGVNTTYIQTIPFRTARKFPGVALIPVDVRGQNQIYVAPGITEDFAPSDIDAAKNLFKTVRKNNGSVVFSLEFPLKTAIRAIKTAHSLGLRILVDPGGIEEKQDYNALLAQKIFLIKPNEHEAKILTGISVSDYESAKRAAAKLLKKRVENVLITMGAKGAFLFNRTLEKHIPIPKVHARPIKDETGCGDQTMAALSAALTGGKNILEAANIGVLAGTLEFHKVGIVPITKKELNGYLK